MPTLVVGYSIKSRGIGLDLGMERWVLTAERAEELPALTEKMWEDRRQIRAQLTDNVKVKLAPYHRKIGGR